MGDRCPHLDYRATGDDREFETPRAYCTVVDRFVQPMRADVCNERYDLRPAEHCEYYREHEGIEDEWLQDGGDGRSAETDGGRAGSEDGRPGDDDGPGADEGSSDGTDR